MTRQSAYDRRRREAGWRRVDVWLDPETLDALGNLQRSFENSEQAAIRHAVQSYAQIFGWGGREE